jgi:hypothetical protein
MRAQPSAASTAAATQHAAVTWADDVARSRKETNYQQSSV